MLIFAPFDLPYSYYQLLRWIVCINSIIFAIEYNSNQNKYLAPLFTLLAIIYNPIAPITTEKEVWTFINIIALLSIIHLDVIKDKKKILKFFEPLKKRFSNFKKNFNKLINRPLVVLCLLLAFISPFHSLLAPIGNLALNAEEEDKLRRQEAYLKKADRKAQLMGLSEKEQIFTEKVRAKYEILKSSQGAAAVIILTSCIWLLIYLPRTILNYLYKKNS